LHRLIVVQSRRLNSYAPTNLIQGARSSLNSAYGFKGGREMSKGKQRFLRTDLMRAMRAAQDLGLTLDRVEIGNDGKIVLVPGKPAADRDGGAVDEWKVA